VSNQDLEVWDTETKRLQDEIDAFLQKFDDIDLLLQRANSEVLYYFQRQTDYTNVDDFKVFLKTELGFYLHTFSMPRAEKRLIRGRIAPFVTTKFLSVGSRVIKLFCVSW